MIIIVLLMWNGERIGVWHFQITAKIMKHKAGGVLL